MISFDFLEKLEPHFCVHCYRPCWHQDLCKKCTTRLPWITHLPSLKTAYIEELQSVFSHEEPVSHWIHRFKYRKQLQFSSLLSNLMLEHLNVPLETQLITVIPLHHKRWQQRGYNQSEILAKHITKKTRIPYQPNLLMRIKNTEPQTQLNSSKRKKNVKNCFRLNPDISTQWKNILIIDDVCTTGATLQEAARAIKKNDSSIRINAWTFARAV